MGRPAQAAGNRWVMDRQPSDSVRSLGWTLLFAALLTLALGTLAHHMPGWLHALAALAALSTFVFPVLIGVCFPEDDWRWDPCLGMILAIVVLLVILATDPAKQTGLGLSPVLLLLYVGLAVLGIWIGRRRLEMHRWDNDDDFRNMFAGSRREGQDSR